MEDIRNQLNGKHQTSRFSLFTQPSEQTKYNTHDPTTKQSINQSKLILQPLETIKNVAYTTSHDDDSCNESVHQSTIDQSIDSSLSAPISPVTFDTEVNVNEQSNDQSNHHFIQDVPLSSLDQLPVQPVRRRGIPLGQVVAQLNNEWSVETLRAAESGDVESMCLVGQMYAEGWGAIDQSINQSKLWLTRAKQCGLGQHVDTIEKHYQSMNQSNNQSMNLSINDSSTDSSGGSSNERHNHSNYPTVNQSYDESPVTSPSRSINQTNKTSNNQTTSPPSFFSTLVNAISPALKVKQAATVRAVAQPLNQTINQSVNQVGRSASLDQLPQPARPVLRQSITQPNNQTINQSTKQSNKRSNNQSVSDDDHHVLTRGREHRLRHIGRSSYHQLFVTAS